MVKGQATQARPVGIEAMSLNVQLNEVHKQRALAQQLIQTDPACQFARIKERQDKIAAARPPPRRPGPPPKNEAETLLAQQPQTTMQQIGHHAIPKLPPPPPPPQPTWSEFERLNRTFPNSTQRELPLEPGLLSQPRCRN